MRINVIMWWIHVIHKDYSCIIFTPFYFFLAWLDFVSRSKSLVTPQMRRVVMGERKRCLDTCRSFCWCTGDEVEFLARLFCHGVKCKQLCHDLTLYNRYYAMLMAFSERKREKGLRQRVFWEFSDQKIMCRCQDSHIFVFSLCF